jgi:hypothetical protein
VVEVRGSLRTRYVKDGGTKVEVEMLGGRLVRRARAGESTRAG